MLDEEINIEVNTIESLVKNLVCGFVAVSINTILQKFCATDTTKNKSIIHCTGSEQKIFSDDYQKYFGKCDIDISIKDKISFSKHLWRKKLNAKNNIDENVITKLYYIAL